MSFEKSYSEAYQNLLTARDLAEYYHQGQKYGGRDYFTYHVLGVVAIVEEMLEVLGHGIGRDGYYRVKTVAYLHDIVEDTDFGIHDIPHEYSIDGEFPNSDVQKAVSLLTKTNDKTRKEYLSDIKKNEIARIVKIADLTFNMNSCVKECDFSRAKKYAKEIAFIAT